MSKIIDMIIGNVDEKKNYRKNEARAKALPAEYAAAYKEIKNYIFHTSGLMVMGPLVALVDLFEEAAANDQRVLDITGPDVATFADELVRGEKSYFDGQRKKLNKGIARKLRKENK